MEQKKKLVLFCISMVLAFVFWRVSVFLRGGKIGILRELTGLNFHHYHYGMLMVFIACIIFIFYKVEKYSLLLAGFGFGTFFDGFVSRIVGNSSRAIEIANYNSAFGLTIFLFGILVLICLNVYLFFRKNL